MVILKLEAERESAFESKDLVLMAFVGSLGKWLLLYTVFSVLSVNDGRVSPPEL